MGRRRKRDVTEEAPEQLVSAMWPGGALSTTGTWASQRLKIQRARTSSKKLRQVHFGQDLIFSYSDQD